MTKTRGNFKVIEFEGEFTDSQIIVMLGENGRGKTTFIRMLAGLLTPDSVEGSDVEIPEFNVSYKPQKSSLPGFLIQSGSCYIKGYGIHTCILSLFQM
ncbi:hypothetical protein Gohar_005441 [Gossypium harknessii]|uniref:ABC transporter domain-containing protein n=1 Tax=Gossypium harknessii TaxID=34285 RepID=A0A7J9H7Z0_9ROSI|nr:hypothetical protein [Gossypium harknessii]